MKLVFLLIAILVNFFNHSIIKSEENIDSAKNSLKTLATLEEQDNEQLGRNGI